MLKYRTLSISMHFNYPFTTHYNYKKWGYKKVGLQKNGTVKKFEFSEQWVVVVDTFIINLIIFLWGSN